MLGVRVYVLYTSKIQIFEASLCECAMEGWWVLGVRVYVVYTSILRLHGRELQILVLATLAITMVGCFRCGGNHYVRECRHVSKDLKGKGGGKGAKAHIKCFNCGGCHFARECVRGRNDQTSIKYVMPFLMI